MELCTISQLSKMYDVSTRTLRYYEEIGLISSIKQEDYAYRTYDDYAERRLQQILILRKLRIKLSDIAKIIDDDTLVNIIEILNENLLEINAEVSSLTIVKNVYEELIEGLNKRIDINIKYRLFDNDDLIKAIEDLPPSKSKIKKGKMTMESLSRANETVKKLKEDDVRIIYLPPCTIASMQYIGENPEDTAAEMIDHFVREYSIVQMKPDIRLFGFDNPCPRGIGETYGYEFWVTIPDELDVPSPLQQKHFEGGLYAAYCIKMGNFEEWKLLWDWVKDSKEYEFERREPFGMNGSIEEHLNAYTYYTKSKENARFEQIDLLVPIKAIR